MQLKLSIFSTSQTQIFPVPYMFLVSPSQRAAIASSFPFGLQWRGVYAVLGNMPASSGHFELLSIDTVVY